MAITQTRSRRKTTGGRYKSYRKKRIFESGRSPTNTKIGETSVKKKRIMGGNSKQITLRSDVMNLVIKGKPVKAKILRVKENSANSNYIRRNILTKGSVVDTDKGSAKVTNRPGQEGVVNGILIE